MLRWIYNNNDTMVMILLILIIMVVVVVLVRILETVVGSKCGLAISEWWSKIGPSKRSTVVYLPTWHPTRAIYDARGADPFGRPDDHADRPTDRPTDSVCLLDNYIVIVVVVGG